MFKKLFQQIREFLGIVPGKIRVYASKSLAVTTRIKNLLDGPIGDVVTEIIPGEWDDAAKKIISKYLGEAIPYLQIVDHCNGEEDMNAIITCWIGELRKHPRHIQDALLVKLAALLTALQDGQKLKMSLYDFYTQAEYSGGK